MLEEIPNDSAAALLLIEHHWAVPLRDAIARAGGFRISDGFISPLDLDRDRADLGAKRRKELHDMEKKGAAERLAPRQEEVPDDGIPQGCTAHQSPGRPPALADGTAYRTRLKPLNQAER